MPHVNEGLKETRGEESLEELPVPLHAEEEAQCPQGVTLEVLPNPAVTGDSWVWQDLAGQQVDSIALGRTEARAEGGSGEGEERGVVCLISFLE